MSLQRLIKRESDSRRPLVGTVIKKPFLISFDAASSPVWAVDVDIGANRRLRNVPVKNFGGSIRYADLNSAVKLENTLLGRFEVVGPAERVIGALQTQVYNLETQVPEGAATNQGFTVRQEEFDYFETLDGASASGTLWSNGVTPFEVFTLLDGDGNPVV